MAEIYFPLCGHVCVCQSCLISSSVDWTHPLTVNDIQHGCDLLINCPLSRTVNTINENQKIVAVMKNDCVVCMEEKVQVHFKMCVHICVCQSCSQKMNKNEVGCQFAFVHNLPQHMTSRTLSTISRFGLC